MLKEQKQNHASLKGKRNRFLTILLVIGIVNGFLGNATVNADLYKVIWYFNPPRVLFEKLTSSGSEVAEAVLQEDAWSGTKTDLFSIDASDAQKPRLILGSMILLLVDDENLCLSGECKDDLYIHFGGKCSVSAGTSFRCLGETYICSKVFLNAGTVYCGKNLVLNSTVQNSGAFNVHFGLCLVGSLCNLSSGNLCAQQIKSKDRIINRGFCVCVTDLESTKVWNEAGEIIIGGNCKVSGLYNKSEKNPGDAEEISEKTVCKTKTGAIIPAPELVTYLRDDNTIRNLFFTDFFFVVSNTSLERYVGYTKDYITTYKLHGDEGKRAYCAILENLTCRCGGNFFSDLLVGGMLKVACDFSNKGACSWEHHYSEVLIFSLFFPAEHYESVVVPDSPPRYIYTWDEDVFCTLLKENSCYAILKVGGGVSGKSICIPNKEWNKEVAALQKATSAEIQQIRARLNRLLAERGVSMTESAMTLRVSNALEQEAWLALISPSHSQVSIFLERLGSNYREAQVWLDEHTFFALFVPGAFWIDLEGKLSRGEKLTVLDCALAGISLVPLIGPTASKSEKLAFVAGRTIKKLEKNVEKIATQDTTKKLEKSVRKVATQDDRILFKQKKLAEDKWVRTKHRIGGRQAFYEPKTDLWYTEVSKEKNDFEVWRVHGKTAEHQGALEVLEGRMYEPAKHGKERFD